MEFYEIHLTDLNKKDPLRGFDLLVTTCDGQNCVLQIHILTPDPVPSEGDLMWTQDRQNSCVKTRSADLT